MSRQFRLHPKFITSLAALLTLLSLPRPVDPAPGAIPRYNFEVTLDYPQRRLEAVQHVTVPNTFGVSVSDIVFNVPAAHKPGVVTLHSVTIGDVAVEYELNDTILDVQLPHPLLPDESITLDLDFVVRVPELLDPQSFADDTLA